MPPAGHMSNRSMRPERPAAGTICCIAPKSMEPIPPPPPMTAASSILPAALPALTADRGRRLWPAVWALGVGSFAIGTGEFVIMGLLPEVARDLGVTIPQAGHVITAYALGVVIGAPVLAVLAAQ